jgi:hypothetical protein
MHRFLLTLVIGMFMVGQAASVYAQDATPSPESLFADQGYQELHVTVTDTEYQAPTEAEAGLTILTLENTTDEPQTLSLVGPGESQTVEELSALLEEPVTEDVFPQWLFDVELAGGPRVPAGETKQVLIELEEGDWWAGGENNQTLAHIEVTGGDDEADEPDADLEVELTEFEFAGLPDDVPAGDHVIKFENTGEQTHFVQLVKAPEGFTVEHFQALINGEPLPADAPEVNETNFFDIGGLAFISSGNTAWVPVTLEPGSYIVVCFWPERESMTAHAQLGMVDGFVVR